MKVDTDILPLANPKPGSENNILLERSEDDIGSSPEMNPRLMSNACSELIVPNDAIYQQKKSIKLKNKSGAKLLDFNKNQNTNEIYNNNTPSIIPTQTQIQTPKTPAQIQTQNMDLNTKDSLLQNKKPTISNTPKKKKKRKHISTPSRKKKWTLLSPKSSAPSNIDYARRHSKILEKMDEGLKMFDDLPLLPPPILKSFAGN